MPRFTHNEFRSLNESISHVANPAAALAQAEEYAALLEEALVALCAELEIDPVELMEDAMTPARMDQSRAKLKKLVQARKAAGPGDTPEYRKASAEYKKGRGELRSKTKVYGKGGKVLKRKPDITED